MTSDHEYTCPLCNSRLTREAYQRALNLQDDRRIKVEREALKRAADAARAKAEAKMGTELRALRIKLDQARANATKKAKLTPQQRDKIARDAAAKTEAKFASQLRKGEVERNRIEQRRQRESEAMRREIEQLQRKAEARDRSHFGQEGEEELEQTLRRHFPTDDIQRKGKGGDLLQTVIERGHSRGLIVYECKRTSTWQATFTRQLKRDMEAHGTRWGLLVSRVLPARHVGIGCIDGVTCCTPQLAHQIAKLFRDAIIALAHAGLSSIDEAQKTETVLAYLRSDDFQNAVRSMGDRITELRGLLDKEKSNHHGWWERREQHYAAVARQASGISSRIDDILTAGKPRRGLRVS